MSITVHLSLERFHLEAPSVKLRGLIATGLMNVRHLSLGGLFAGLLSLLLLVSGCSLPQVSAEDRIFLPLSLELLGEYRLPTTTVEGTTVGGLSALNYDRQNNCFYALSDDRSRTAPARFYTLEIDLGKNSPQPHLDQVSVVAMTPLQQDGEPYAQETIDPEGIALSAHQSVFISSEGVTRQGVKPLIGEYALDSGAWQQGLKLPETFLPAEAEAEERGVADNLGFESLTLNPEGDRLFTATESALLQDYDPDTDEEIRSRLLHYWIGEPEPILISTHLYPVASPPAGAVVNGLVELAALDSGGHFLSLERSASLFGGYSAQLFQIATGGATDISQMPSLKGALKGVQPIRKRLLLDLAQLGIELQNLEGMTLGPRLQDGSQSLLLVSDNNFETQRPTQFLLFRLVAGRQAQSA